MYVKILGVQRKGLKDWKIEEEENKTYTVAVRLGNKENDVKTFYDVVAIDWTFRGAHVVLHTADKEITCDFSDNVDEVKITYSK